MPAELYWEVFARSLDAVAVIDAEDLTYVVQNESHQRLVGYTDEELRGQTPAIHLDPPDAERVVAALREQSSFRGEVRSTHRDGTPLLLQLAAFPACDRDGRPRYYVGIKRDISRLRHNEEEALLRDRQRATSNSLLTWSRSDLSLGEQVQGALMELLLVPWLDLAPHGAIFLSDPEGSDELVRAAASHYPAEVERVRFQAGPPARLEPQAGQGLPGQHCAPLMLGDTLHGVLVVQPRRELARPQQQALAGLAGTLAGMVVRRRAQEALEASQARFRDLAQSLPGIVYQYELSPEGEGSFPFVSDAIEMFGHSVAELQRDPNLAWEQVHPDDRAGLEEAVRVSAETLTTWTHDYRAYLPEGELRWLRSTARPQRLEGGGIRWSGLTTDVTERRQAAEELQAAKEAAEAADRAKSRFLANVSHDLRTPLNAVIGMCELMLKTPLDSSQQEYAETIRDSADSLLLLIEDLLDATRIETDQLALEPAPFELRGLVEGSLAQVAGAAAAKGLTLISLYEGEVPSRVIGDAGRIRQVLVNLLSNAVKFTRSGEVVATVAASPREGGHELTFAVRDTGPGIPSERMHLLFEPFRQIEPQADDAVGTGLGLTICKGLVELMGGRIWAESEPGAGALFRFTVPVDALVGQGSSSGSLFRLVDRPLLLVSENEGERRMLAQQCERWGLRVHEVPDVKASQAWLRENEAEAICLDGALWGQACEVELGLPIVLLLSVGQPEPDPQAAADHGLAGVLFKPFRASPLVEVLTSVLGTREEGAPSVEEPLAKSLPLRVLVVEDNGINRRVAQQLLAELGYEAVLAAGGEEALALCDAQPFDLLLMDVQMPKLDGLEATRLLRQRYRPGPRVVAMTASANLEDRRRCLEAGMDAYLSKPVRLGALRVLLERLFGGAPLDTEQLDRLRRAGGTRHPGLLAELIEAFLEEGPALLRDIETAEDAEGAIHAAHGLKGAALDLGGHALARVCGQLESFGQHEEWRGGLVRKARRELQRLSAFLRDAL